MADKLTQQVLDALTRAAAEPTGLPLYAGKADLGLFPNVAGAKPAAQKCLAEDLVRVVGADPKSKTPRDLYGLTDKGWEYLLAAVNPKQVLEDFVRVLEARQGEVTDLLATARRMADSLQGLRDAVSRVLPAVTAVRVREALPSVAAPRVEEPVSEFVPSTHAGVPEAPALSPFLLRGGVEEGLLPAPALAPAVLAHLAEHTGPTDCPLPELFRALAQTAALTIGEFHDCLRELHSEGRVSLPQWTGPLYALPEPQYALLIGHGIAYYASLREAGVREITGSALYGS
ncbi:hypothetical protein GobsT_59760 [Gemmata obscuriglobus]|uniref:Uncharacterized protein n=1 Tax=Gemmata obscuriglobus TaxID=114 RepID=A0A2Z3GVY7_9BACT|nr:hypothetical protein [Gemmata obscuriglobus]AWM36242.1 hypothetical protein C1280_03920 [Gemmata obscuriglobus]QEG31155.1 hypothetical protein GobsT_59760 [Gemmata obscuriglobus]VTS10493.1 Uncharacterized protein OS=Candidatus Entotheonella sp. TSY2 GN=ETSY2_22115 PE=4 SV=1 [Gemmata obscuriglobus UQM 2246]